MLLTRGKGEMGLTYDQRSEIRMAFDEAFISPERRRSVRFTHHVDADIYEWKKGRQGLPFVVRIEDFSPAGVGMVHGTAMPVDRQYLIKVPRPQWGELIVLMTVVRCDKKDNGQFNIGLEISSILDQTVVDKLVDVLPGPRVTTKRTKLLLLLFGISGIGISLILN